MNKIIVMWIGIEDGVYEKEMRVVFSNHPRFKKGSRFDFGFMQIACDDGYIVEVLPL